MTENRVEPTCTLDGSYDEVVYCTVCGGLARTGNNEQNFDNVLPGSYYHKAVNWAVENGVTVGVGKNCFAPDKPCTRIESIIMIWRAYAK